MLRHSKCRAEIALVTVALTTLASLRAATGGEVPADPFLEADTAAAIWDGASLESGGDSISSPWEFDAALDGGITLAQAQTRPPMPTVQQQRVSTALRRPGLRGAALGTLASVPYMIGDTGAGTCLGFSGLLDVGLAHPTLACSRLNVAEANSALPADRVYYSYRRFENATPVSVYQFEQTLDVDRHLLAFERTYWDGMCSIEMRLPLEYRLTSNFLSIVTPGPPFNTVDIVAADNERRTELGNVSLIFKSLIVERQSFAMSAGLGVTLPTAQDVDYGVAVVGTIDYPQFPGLSATTTGTVFSTVFSNETVYLLPFMAWIYAPSSRWYHQGFLQIEAAANPSRVTAYGSGDYTFSTGDVYFFFTAPDSTFIEPVPVRVDLHAQSLLRANLGWGYRFWEGRGQNRYGATAPKSLTGLFELHYTSTLQDANLSRVPLREFGTRPIDLQDIQIGNINNRVDILNVATGMSLQVNNWIVNGGVIVPLRDCPECGFDIETNAQIQRLF